MSRMPRRAALAVAVTVSLTSLAACAGTDSTPVKSASGGSTASAAAPIAAADPNAPVTLTWWTGQTADAQNTLNGLAKDFTKLHPNVTIKASSGASTTDELLQKMSAGFAAGTYPDISYAFASWASELGASGKTLDITGNVKDAAVKWDEFPKAARAAATVGGKVIGMPSVVGNLGLLYNKTVFDSAGLPYPTNETTWEQFREMAKKLSNPAKNIFGTTYDVSGSEGTTWAMWPLLWQNGGHILADDNKTAAFNSDAGVKSVQFWRDMAQTDKSVYLDQTAEKAPGLFQSGNIGMMMGGPWFLWDLNQAKVKYGVTYLPGVGTDHQTVVGGDLWVLFDHQDKNRAYWSYEFTRWLTDAAQDERWNLNLGNLPLRSSESASQVFQDTEKQMPGFAIFAKNLDNAKQPRPVVSGYTGLSKAFGQAVAKILQGQGDTKATLDEAKTKADKALADL